MTKYARMFIQYKYGSTWLNEGNLGDCVQNLAVENVYKYAGINPDDLVLINRDELPKYNGEKASLVMQSWFGDAHNVFPLPWSDKITPTFIGFHLSKYGKTRISFIEKKVHEKIVPPPPIGCRDRNTRDFLRGLGLDAYFSGCMTLTFEKRKSAPKNGKIFVVDLTGAARAILPKAVEQVADFSISHFYYWENYPVSYDGAMEFENHARVVLERYRTEAKLVITSRIHVAMPCIAMGIPVVFIHEEADCERFDVMQGLVPMYEPKHAKYINWNPKAVDIEPLKQAIIRNAIARIENDSDLVAIRELNEITEKLKPIRYKTVFARLRTIRIFGKYLFKRRILFK